MKVFISLVVSLGVCSGTCNHAELDKEIASKDGDYILAASVNVGVVNRNEQNERYCNRTASKLYSIQKALVFRWIIENKAEEFRALNKTLGYVIYDVCNDYTVTARVAGKIANNPKVVGAAVVDIQKFISRSALITTAQFIPTFTYMYNDNELLKTNEYPTLFSLIDTEVQEAQATIHVLRELGYLYIDIWYHKYSEVMAHYIYDNYLQKYSDSADEGGCGRITEITLYSDVPKIKEKYKATGGKPAAIQMILSNSNKVSRQILEFLINVMGMRNTMYVFGMSNGRKMSQPGYISILNKYNLTTESLLFPQAYLLNLKLEGIRDKLSAVWRYNVNTPLDDLYRGVQEREECGEEPCSVTSWNGYVVAGVKVLLQALKETLQNHDVNSTCIEEFRESVFNLVVREDREVEIDIDVGSHVHLDVKFKNRTFSIGYEMEVYQGTTNTTLSIGQAYPHAFLLNTEQRQSLASIQYEQTCSSACNPGSHKDYPDIRNFPCCWECHECENNYYSVVGNSMDCQKCGADQISSSDNSGKKIGCKDVEVIYMRKNDALFIIGILLGLLGFFTIVSVSGYIYAKASRPIIKASDPSFIYVMLLTLACGVLASLIPLIKPSVPSCGAEYACFISTASLLTSNLFWRCYKIYSVFASANNFEKPRFQFILTNKGQTVLLLVVLLFNMSSAVVNLVFGAWTLLTIQDTPHLPVNLACGTAPSYKHWYLIVIPFITPLLLYIYTLVLGFKMRHFPHNFRETTNIFVGTVSVGLTCVMFLSGYTLSPPFIKTFLRFIVLYLTCITFLCCLFLPKVLVLAKNIDQKEEKAELQREVQKFTLRKFVSRAFIKTKPNGREESQPNGTENNI